MASWRNDSFTRRCSCPPSCRNTCRHNRNIDCKNIDRIIQALNNNFDDPLRLSNARSGQRIGVKYKRHKSKAYKPKHYKDSCVPMTPSMHTRLRYITHCPIDPMPFSNDYIKKRPRHDYNQKYVPSESGSDTHIYMPTPAHFIKHTDSNTSIIKVPSPKISGEVTQVQKASVKPGEFKPPLPAKSGHALIAPHSGIILNKQADYIPEPIYMLGGRGAPSGATHPCYKGKYMIFDDGACSVFFNVFSGSLARRGICSRVKCGAKKCRRYAALQRKRLLAARRRAGHARGPGYSSSKIRSCHIRGFQGRRRRRRPQKYNDGEDDLCGLNAPKLDHPHIAPNLRRGALETHSLTIMPCNKDVKQTIPYGILTASLNMYDGKFGPRSKGRQALPMIVMAYCLAFHYHPKQWTTKLLDNLLDAGDTWYLQLLDKVHDHSSVQGMCEVLPFGKKQNLVLNGKKMQILLGEPDIVGYTMSLDPKVYNLCRGMRAFFMENRAGILLTRILKVVIWKDHICYYIFDPAGRDNKACTSFTSASALITVKDLNAVAEVILSRSILDDQKFVLAPLKVIKMADEKSEEDFDSEPELTQTEKSLMSYRLLNENCAIVNANMHLGDRCFEESKNRQALTIAVAAMTYAKISPPNSWFTKTLDKILRMGNKLYVDSLPYKQLTDISIDNIPNEINLGPYTCEIIIYRERIKGQLFTTKECILNIKTGLEEFFSREHNSGILEFNNYFIAIWRQKDMYYLFDCYPRTNDGGRSINIGKACCLMLLNPAVMAEVFKKNWDYLPPTTQFFIHAFKVLKLKKKSTKHRIVCTLSDEGLPVVGRKILKAHKGRGDSVDHFHNILPLEAYDDKKLGIFNPDLEEEHMGDIISLVDSIQEDYLPAIPMKYKKMPPEVDEQKVFNLDSPTVSVTQVVPPWPKPRDKTNELPEPDPDPEPTPPPTPPELPPPEGGMEEAEEEEDEETMERKKEEEKRRKAEEEEARRKAEELPPPFPPPPPTPQSEPEVMPTDSEREMPNERFEEEQEVKTVEPTDVNRRILLTEDAQLRSKLRELRKKMTPPLTERDLITATTSEEITKITNFTALPDDTQILRGKGSISGTEAPDILPFVAIMALVTSYKYAINTWSSEIVTFVLETAKMLHKNKKDKFQLSPIHIIPKIAIGQQAFAATIDVFAEGPAWNMEEVLSTDFFERYDRGMITTPSYSCAIFQRNGLYYLYDGSPCNAMGIRDFKNKENKGKACFVRFRKLKDLVARIQYNKDRVEDQQFIVSRILVRRLLTETRQQLPEDYDYETGMPKNPKSKIEVIKQKEKKSSSSSTVSSVQKKSEIRIGYKETEGLYKIEGTATASSGKTGGAIQSCHFISLIAMLMATMHPIRTWTPQMVDICVEKGHEIAQKTTNFAVCEKRVIKNLLLEGKIININIKKIVVINNNPEKSLEQFVKAVMRRLRYVIMEMGGRNMVICKTEGYYHLFDPYPIKIKTEEKKEKVKGKKDKDKDKKKDKEERKSSTSESGVASWTLYRTIDLLIDDLNRYPKSKNDPSFYTFELTSAKTAPRYASYYYKLSPNFQPIANPNAPYLKPRRQTPLVDEKMYWLEVEVVPWSRMNLENDLGLPRNTPRTMWKNWDIELPGDLFSLWGCVHPTDSRFDVRNRGKQYLATGAVALAMAEMCDFDAWTSTFLDGIVNMGDKYHTKCAKKVGDKPNYELNVEDLDTTFDEKYPFSFTATYTKVIFGFVYNMLPDRFNLSNALSYFFESNKLGLLVSPGKNLAFGRNSGSYFMFDCQSFGAPLYCPGQGGSYVLKCESLNRLLYCMIIALNIKKHGQQFHLYAGDISVKEKQ